MMKNFWKRIWEEINSERPVTGAPEDYSLIQNLFFFIIFLIAIPLILEFIGVWR